jgi:hypothetical protein
MPLLHPASPVRTALDGLFPLTGPGLRFRLGHVWERAADTPFEDLEPLAGLQREAVALQLLSFLSYVRGKRRIRSRHAAPRRQGVVWRRGTPARLAAEIRRSLPPRAGGAGLLLRELQSVLARIEKPALLRLTRAGALALGMPPALPWNPEARPAPLEPRRWSGRWVRLDIPLPALARPLAATLLAFLVAGTIEAVQLRHEETPFLTLADALLAGAWPLRIVDADVFYATDIGELLALVAPPRHPGL